MNAGYAVDCKSATYLMLHPDPEFVHFYEILKNEFNCIINAFGIPAQLKIQRMMGHIEIIIIRK